MSKPYFTAGLRTPFARAFKGDYKDVRPDDLLLELIEAQKEKNKSLWTRGVSDFIVGCAYPEGEQGYNIARMVSLGSGLNAPGLTVNRLCASSLEAVAIAALRVKAGWGDLYLTGGIESMSRIPRGGAGFSPSAKVQQASSEAYIQMGFTAENVAKEFPSVSRAEQEKLAGKSHELADQAWKDGLYQQMIHPYLIEKDQFIRVPVNYEKMSSLPPAFKEDGVITAATSSPLTDGATSGWVASEEVLKEHGYQDALEIEHASWGHVAPEVMGMGPVPAVQNLLKETGIALNQISAFEINEAFAVQVLASGAELGLDMATVNAWGGAMALGHPLGASGLRLVMTLHGRLREMAEDGARGIATLCVGGGQGMALLCRYKKF